VAGNSAYDMIKFVLGRARGAGAARASAGTLQLGPDTKIGTRGQLRDLLDYTARAAVIVQCKEHDLPAPRFRDLRVSDWKRVHVDGRYVFRAQVHSRFESPFRAVVRVPEDGLERHGVDVTIHQAITWETDVRDQLPPLVP
jgi:hypothetical protein